MGYIMRYNITYTNNNTTTFNQEGGVPKTKDEIKDVIVTKLNNIVDSDDEVLFSLIHLTQYQFNENYKKYTTLNAADKTLEKYNMFFIKNMEEHNNKIKLV